MDCRTFHRKLEDYLEGGLDFAGRFGMERHAEQCYACEKEVNAALSLRQLARQMRKIGAPVDFETSLQARIRGEQGRRRFWQIRTLWLYGFEGFSWRVAGVTALATCFIVGTIGYFHFGMRTDRSAGSPAAAGDIAGGANEKGTAVARSAAGTPDEASALNRLSAFDLGTFSRFARDNWAIPYAEPGDSDYVDILVPGMGGQQLIMQLPKTIRMRYGQPSREYFIRNVSH